MDTLTKGRIFFISGCPGVGKSTIAKEIASRFEKGVHIDVDYIRLSVVSGLALPEPGKWTEEHTLQFKLAHIAAGKQAKTYADSGFAVVAEHCSHAQYIEAFLAEAPDSRVIALTADLEENQVRNSLRTSGSFDYPSLVPVIEMLNRSMAIEHAEAGYPIVNTTGQTVEHSAETILKLTS
ncbi:MAG TPA: AAA family ATPase [Fimbriimonas sp.]|nr:AAA family ATPase [Fimbriimonas sp.]